MKKKLLLILLLLIPFIVNAKTIDSVELKWRYEDQDEDYIYYEFENTFVISSGEKFVSIDKNTGKEKTLVYNNGYHALNGDNKTITLIKEESDEISITSYDEHLNEIKRKEIEHFEIDYIGIGDISEFNTQYLITGNKIKNNEYYRIVYIVDDNGIVNHLEFKTYQKTKTFKDNGYDLYFIDFNNNIYQYTKEGIVPKTLKNNQYIYAENDKITLKSITGEDIKSVAIPNGKGTRYVIYNNHIYVLTGAYSDNNDGSYNVSYTLYAIDEDFNIVNSNTVDQTSTFYEAPPEEGYDYNHYNIISKNSNGIYIYLNGMLKPNYSLNTYNLTLSQINNYSLNFYDKAYLFQSINGAYSFSGKHNYGSLTLDNRIREELLPTNDGDYSLSDCDNYTGKNNSVSIALVVKKNGEKNFYKQYLLIFDNDYNLLLKKELTDWYEDANIRTSSYVELFGDYILIASNGIEDPFLTIYDSKGKLVRDLSSTVKDYKYLNITGIRLTENDLFIKYDIGWYQRYTTKGVSAYVNSKVLGEEIKLRNNQLPPVISVPTGTWYNDNPNSDSANHYTALLYFSIKYKVDTKINGKGDVTYTPENPEPGDTVEINVTPEKGYVLSYVKVIDANGNNIPVTDNTFVMPASDVVIEAVFTPTNPNTGDIAIFVICLIALSSIPIFTYERKKLQRLK